MGKRIDSSALFSSANNSAIAGSNTAYYASYYYTTGNELNYTNRYHFLRFGTDWSTSVHFLKVLSLRWQLGAGLDVLIASNGLHYDPNANKLFSNNSLYSKFQFYGSTGFDIGIGREPFLYVGPHWQYNFTRMSPETSTPQHVYIPSLRVLFVWPGKKKKIK